MIVKYGYVRWSAIPGYYDIEIHKYVELYQDEFDDEDNFIDDIEDFYYGGIVDRIPYTLTGPSHNYHWSLHFDMEPALDHAGWTSLYYYDGWNVRPYGFHGVLGEG